MDKEKLLLHIEDLGSIYKVAEILNCSTVTIRNYIKKYNLSIPKGFYSLGKPIGRPKGISMTENQKKLLSKLFKGSGNPMFGKTHNKDTIDKMVANHADFAGDKNPFKKSLEDPLKLLEHKERCKKIWDGRDTAWREVFSSKLSESMAKSNKLCNINLHKNHKSGHILTDKAGEIFVRSSWECAIAYYLDNNINVLLFSLESMYIPYSSLEGNIKNTRVDFIVTLNNGQKILMEVKPKAIQKIKNNPYKIIAYKEYCEANNMFFILIDEDFIYDLSKLDIILTEITNKYN